MGNWMMTFEFLKIGKVDHLTLAATVVGSFKKCNLLKDITMPNNF